MARANRCVRRYDSHPQKPPISPPTAPPQRMPTRYSMLYSICCKIYNVNHDSQTPKKGKLKRSHRA